MLILGADPGITGAYAVLDSAGTLLALEDMPIIRDAKSCWVDADALTSALFKIANGDRIAATVERVHAMPKNGSQAAFSQGCTFGSLLAALQLVRARIEFVSPHAWKKALGLGPDKALSRDRARLLYPDASLDRVKDHNRGEAILIAHWSLTRPRSAAA